MNSLSLILRILAIIAAVAAGVLFYMGKGKLAEQKAAMEAAQAATVVVEGELAEANDQIATLEGELSEERTTHDQTKRDLENTRSEMYTAREEVSRTQRQLSQANDNIADLEESAKRLRTELVEVEQELAISNKAVAELAVVKERVAELQDRNSKISAELAATKNPLRQDPNAAQSGLAGSGSSGTSATRQPLTKLTVAAETTVQSVSAESGLIVFANNADLNVALGSEAVLIQEMKPLGKVSIVKMTKEFVVANILPGANVRSLAAGSTVKLR